MEQKNLKAITLIFVITLIIGLGYLKFGIIFPVSGDTKTYYDPIALNIVRGQGFTLKGVPTAEVTPGYPLFLALIYYIFGHNYTAVRIIQFLILALIGIIVFSIARNYLELSFNFAFLTSLMVVLWPYLILYSTLILTEILFIFFFLLSVLFFLKFQEKPSMNKAIILGMLFGVSALTRQVALFLPLWIIFFLLLFIKFRANKSYFLKMALVLSLFFLILVPWTVRNYIRFNKLIPLTSVIGPVLEKSYVTLNYTENSIALKPGEANLETIIVSRLKNIYLFWNPGAGGTRTQTLIERYPWANYLVLSYKIVFLTILTLAFFSLRFIKKKKIFLLWCPIFYFWTLHTILFPYPRYTLPIMPLVILLFFYSINYLSSKYKLKNISHFINF